MKAEVMVCGFLMWATSSMFESSPAGGFGASGHCGGACRLLPAQRIRTLHISWLLRSGWYRKNPFKTTVSLGGSLTQIVFITRWLQSIITAATVHFHHHWGGQSSARLAQTVWFWFGFYWLRGSDFPGGAPVCFCTMGSTQSLITLLDQLTLVSKSLRTIRTGFCIQMWHKGKRCYALVFLKAENIGWL